MKKFTLFAVCLTLVLSAAACTAQTPPPGEDAASVSMPEQSLVEEPEESEQEIEAPESLPPVGDAAMYRGVVTAMEAQDDGILVTLEQAEGTDFGSGALKVLITEEARIDFELDKLEEGAYLQVYYGAAMDGSVEQPASAITASHLPDADLCIYNGSVAEINQDEDEPGTGSILLVDPSGEGSILFHYGEETQFYLDFDALEAGDLLNVFHTGATTKSDPPQGNALEVRKYAAAETAE